MHTICSHEPSTHTINSTNVIVDIMLSLDNQWIEEVLGSMGTTGHPYWTAVERWRRWHLCMMANSTWNLATAFSWRPATQHQAITGSLYSEENVDDSTSLDYYIVLDILDDIRCESSTTWCRQIVELLFFTRGVYVQKSPECKYFLVHILFAGSSC